MKTEIEKLVDEIYHAQTYGKDCDKLIEKLNKLTAVNKQTKAENPQLNIGAVISRFNSDTFIDNVCLSYRHDFGLMAEQDKQRLRFECKEWIRAISNNWEYFKNGL